jgi:hypothetical protein
MDQVSAEVRAGAPVRLSAPEAAVLAALLGLVAPGLLAAQRITLDAGAGGFAGSRPTYNGPTLHVRVSAVARPDLWLGARVSYRDDDPSGGQARSVALLGEGILVLTSRSGSIYVPAGLGLEWVRVTTQNAIPPGDAKSGTYAAADLGLGIELNGGARRVIIEGRQSFRTFGNSRSLTVGLRSYPSDRGASSATLDLMVSTPFPLNDRYTRDRAYQGYALSYRHPLRSRIPTDLRFALGIDFFRFTSGGSPWSTGSVGIAVGAGVRVLSSANGVASVSLVSHAGVLQFAEPSGRSPSPLLAVGAEIRFSPGPIGLVGSPQLAVAGGPAGTLTTVQVRLGVAAAM